MIDPAEIGRRGGLVSGRARSVEYMRSLALKRWAKQNGKKEPSKR